MTRRIIVEQAPEPCLTVLWLSTTNTRQNTLHNTKVYKELYISVLRRLRENISKKPGLREKNLWILRDDNAPLHRDLASSDFDLFPKLKLPLRGKRFQSLEEIKQNPQKELKGIPKSTYEKY
ncbi:uncharacterized protein LOC120773623 [Bactrocera tryoni]|uniref:uncharacterized protein LOC120773623 n=1 Tax=Bactrocera tryoni TaxID=59916 RepID=UPI001A99D160|nr:uncharacterized protein LOC120773623 [Bactrocera tryoni]